MPNISEKRYDRVGESLLHTTLENGLAIYVIPKPEFAKSYAFFAVDYGGMDLSFSLDGKPCNTPAGVAHFLEHKMFDMPDGNAMQAFAARGASNNAFTSSAMTAYHYSCTDSFYENLRTLLSFVLTPYFSAESVQKEQGIIGQEIGMYDDDPDYKCYVNLLDCLYHTHPLRNSVLGTVESISHITDATLYNCHSAFYSPSNMVLCCAGDVDMEKVTELAKELCPASAPSVKRAEAGNEPSCVKLSEKSERMSVSLPQFLLGLKLDPPTDGSGELLLPMLADVACSLVAGPSSALYTQLYAEGLINSGFGCGAETVPGAAYAYFSGESRDPAAVRERILQEAQRIVCDGADEALLRRIVRSSYGTEVRGLNSMENICYNQAEAHFRGYEYFSFPELYDALDTDRVINFIREFFSEQRVALSVISPLAD